MPTITSPQVRSSADRRSRIGVPLGNGGPLIRRYTPPSRQSQSITRGERGSNQTTPQVRDRGLGNASARRGLDSGVATPDSRRSAIGSATRNAEAAPSTRGQQLLDASRLRRSLNNPPLTRRYIVSGDRTHGVSGRQRAALDRHEVVVGHSHHTRAANRYLCRSTGSSYASYHDRPHAIYHGNNHLHRYYDSHHRSYHHVVWPHYSYPVHYHHGHYGLARHVYPFHHRKYVFVSLGGYWPSSCSSLRYYWYGWHPYTWYGYNPVPYQVAGTTNNYYTYNMGKNQEAAASIRADEVVKTPEPPQERPADRQFSAGVQAFEAGKYQVAADHFGEAMALDADDVILPFAFAQALFAQQEYRDAIDVLRMALSSVSLNQATIFYPRGLYQDDDMLFTQVDELIKVVETKSQDTGLQLLLGYHLLGIGETDAALEPLERASLDPQNQQAAGLLIDLLAKVKAQEIEED